MGHFQSCCGTLTLRHAKLNREDKCMTAGGINSVHCGLCKAALTSLCMLKERERERERREGGGREGEATDPGREKKTRHEKDMCAAPACPGSGSPASCKADATKEEKGNPGRPPERRRRRRRRREKRAKKTPKPSTNEPSEKPRGVLDPKPCQNTRP